MPFDRSLSYGTVADTRPVLYSQGGVFYDSSTGAVVTNIQPYIFTSSGPVNALAQTAGEVAAGVAAVNPGFDTRPYIDLARFAPTNDPFDGSSDLTIPLRNAILSLNGQRGTVWWRGTVKVTSQIVLPSGCSLQGDGWSETNATGSAARGASCLLRGFTGALAMLLIQGNDCSVDMIDFDGNLQGTGDNLQVIGGRCSLGKISSRNAGGRGLRIGRTDLSLAAGTITNATATNPIVLTVAGHGHITGDVETLTALPGNFGTALNNLFFTITVIDANTFSVPVSGLGFTAYTVGGIDTHNLSNANAWSLQRLRACGNTSDGMAVDDTNTSTSLSYPLGTANVNAGTCQMLDLQSNGGDGLQIGNANDCVFMMVLSQSNTGIGIHFKTDGTNSGPRCNHILGNDSENNTGNDIQIDAATLPLTGPGLYNLILGSRSLTVNPRYVNNSTSSLILIWDANMSAGQQQYHFGAVWNIVSAAAGSTARLKMFADTLFAQLAEIGAKQTGTSGGRLALQTRVDGGSLTDGIVIDATQSATFGKLLAFGGTAPTIASAATIAPTTPVAFVSGVAAIATITAPPPINGGGGVITLLPTGIFTTTTGGNIALASTAVVGKALLMTYDAVTLKWYPSY